jgi:hypothetical protein
VINTTFVIVGDSGLIMTSTDGTTWTTIATTITANLSGVACDRTNGVLIAVGDSNTIIKSTTNAATWTTVVTPVACSLNAVAWVETLDLFVAVGDAGVILNSIIGGSAWNQTSSGVTANLNAVASYLNDVVVVGDSGKILTSPNTILWTAQTSGVTTDLNGVATATIGTTVTAVAVGDGGKVVTSAYNTTFSFNAWNATAYPSTTTNDLYTAKTVNSTLYIMGSFGKMFSPVGTVWTDSGISVGIEGSADLTFDPSVNLLSVDADIIPQTSNVWKLGNTTNRWHSANFSANGMTVGTVVVQQTPTLTLELRDSANLSNLANIKVNTVDASNVLANLLDANLANIDTANIGNLASANANIGNLTVANLTLTSLTITDLAIPGNITASNGTFTGTVTANHFVGDGSNLTNLPKKATGPLNSVQFADANLDLASSPNLTFDATTQTLATNNIVSNNIVSNNIVSSGNVSAGNVTAAYLRGDGSNITGLPVQSIVAGANVTVTNSGGVWTISAIGSNDGNGGNGGSNGNSNGGSNTTTVTSSPPVKSVQYAGPNGTFDSTSALLFDESINELSLTGNMVAFNFNGNVGGGNGSFLLLTADEVIADTFSGDLRGNVFGGNVSANVGTFTGNLSAGNITTGNLVINHQVSNSANIGNIHISRSNIREFGSVNDNFVIDSARSNIVLQGANVATLNVDAPYVMIRGGNVAGNATGGNVIVESGSGGSAGKAGTLILKGGLGGVGNDGGNVNILGGNSGAGGDGGTINIIPGVTHGDATTIHGANLYLQSGNTINEDAGTLIIQGGNATGTNLYGGNIRITPGTGSLADGNVYIANIMWPNELGLNNQVLATDGNGNAYWGTLNSGSVGTVTVSNIVHGLSNVSIDTHSGPVTVSINGTANIATFTQSGLETGNVKTNSVILGNATQTACATTWYKKSTTGILANQILLQLPAGLQISTDFKIISHDPASSTRQSNMITTVTAGPLTNYSDYATTTINTPIVDFVVDQLGGNIRLLASPRVSALIQYTIIVSTY